MKEESEFPLYAQQIRDRIKLVVSEFENEVNSNLKKDRLTVIVNYDSIGAWIYVDGKDQ